MLITFKQWLEFNTGSTSYDSGLHRSVMMPTFKVIGSSIQGNGLKQSDPMKFTLHGKGEKEKDGSPAAHIYGFAPKKSKKKSKG